CLLLLIFFFFFQAEDGIRDFHVTGVQRVLFRSRLGAARKAIIFTESKRTQEYLLNLLADTPYGDGIVLFNGTNSDQRAQAIYKRSEERRVGEECRSRRYGYQEI